MEGVGAAPCALVLVSLRFVSRSTGLPLRELNLNQKNLVCASLAAMLRVA